MKILLDTNMLLAPVQFRADIYIHNAEFFTTSRCVEELEIMKKKKTRAGLEARAALILAKSKNIKIIKVSGKTDDSLIEAAIKNRCTVATNDKELIKKLKKAGIPILRLRQKKILVEE